jgi:hypothetical protein
VATASASEVATDEDEGTIEDGRPVEEVRNVVSATIDEVLSEDLA